MTLEPVCFNFKYPFFLKKQKKQNFNALLKKVTDYPNEFLQMVAVWQ